MDLGAADSSCGHTSNFERIVTTHAERDCLVAATARLQYRCVDREKSNEVSSFYCVGVWMSTAVGIHPRCDFQFQIKACSIMVLTWEFRAQCPLGTLWLLGSSGSLAPFTAHPERCQSVSTASHRISTVFPAFELVGLIFYSNQCVTFYRPVLLTSLEGVLEFQYSQSGSSCLYVVRPYTSC